MVEYSKANLKLSNTQLKKLKNAFKYKTRTTLRMILKMLDVNDLPHELLLTARQKTSQINAFNNNMSTDLKLTKAQISKILQAGGFLGSLISKLADPLMKVAVPFAKIIQGHQEQQLLQQLMQEFKNIYGSGTTNLIISKKEMNDIIKIVEALGDFNILLKGVTKTIKNKTNEQKGEFLSMLLGSLRASLLRNMLVGKEL